MDLKKDKSGVYGYTDREMRQLAELWESHNPVGIQPRGSEEGRQSAELAQRAIAQ